MSQQNPAYSRVFLILTLVLILCWMANISIGSVFISLEDIWKSIWQQANGSTYSTIIKLYRVPKSITAILVGSGLGVAGLLMQTLFRNPLAGPYVLGLSSGASLGVAFCIMGASVLGNMHWLFTQKWSYAIAASLGSLLVFLAILIVASRIKDTMAILIVGLMFASVTSGIVSILSFFTSAEALQKYVFWGFGSLGNLSWSEVYILATFYSVGIFLSILAIKALNALQIGEAYAKSMGLAVKQKHILIMTATSILCGVITAFAGPIAFIGLVVPHITRQFFKTSDHKILLPAVMLVGSTLMLFCDALAQLPGSARVLPINAITALIGAPIVIFVVIKNRRLLF